MRKRREQAYEIGERRERPITPAAVRATHMLDASASRRRDAERPRARQEPRPRPLRQWNALAQASFENAVTAFAGKIDALDAVFRRQRADHAPQVLRVVENAVGIAEHRDIE